MAVMGRAFGKAHDQASCEVARTVSRRIGLSDSISGSLYDIHEWWNGACARSLRGEQIARPARIARVATGNSELLSLGVRDVVDALRISRRTAEHHVQHIYDKIGVSTRAAAALFALEHDLLAHR